MNKNSTAADVVVAVGKAAGSVIGAIAIAVFFCGPQILPWYKK
jgi:hypothetical protein